MESFPRVFPDHVTNEKIGGMKKVPSVFICSDSAKCFKPIGWRFTLQMDDDLKLTLKASQDLGRSKSRSLEQNPVELYFTCCRKNQRQPAQEHAGTEDSSKDLAEPRCLVMYGRWVPGFSRRLQRTHDKELKMTTQFMIVSLSNYFWCLKRGGQHLKVLQFLHLSPNLDVKPLKLKLHFNFNSSTLG